MARIYVYRDLTFDVSDSPEPSDESLEGVKALVSDIAWEAGLGAFLSSVNGGYPDNNDLFLDDGSEYELDLLYPAEDVEDGILHQYKNLVLERTLVPSSLLPIGVGSGGDFWCIERSTGKIAFLPMDPPDEEPIFVFRSFDEMIDCLRSSSE